MIDEPEIDTDVGSTPAGDADIVDPDVTNRLGDIRSEHFPSIGRIRREFLCRAAIAMLARPDTDRVSPYTVEEAWDAAEELCREGQGRGYLP